MSRSLAGRFEDVGGDSPAPRNWFSEKTSGEDGRVLSHPVAPRQSRQENRRLRPARPLVPTEPGPPSAGSRGPIGGLTSVGPEGSGASLPS